MQILLACAIGLVSGTVSGLLGVGGGIIMVPAMLLLLSPPIRDIDQAIGTSLAVIVPTALMGSYKHFTLGNVDWRIVLAIAPLAIVGGYFGAWLTGPLPAETLRKVFGGLLVLVGMRLLLMK